MSEKLDQIIKKEIVKIMDDTFWCQAMNNNSKTTRELLPIMADDIIKMLKELEVIKNDGDNIELEKFKNENKKLREEIEELQNQILYLEEKIDEAYGE